MPTPTRRTFLASLAAAGAATPLVAQWARTERGDRPFQGTGLAADRERELLAKWHAAAKPRAQSGAGR